MSPSEKNCVRLESESDSSSPNTYNFGLFDLILISDVWWGTAKCFKHDNNDFELYRFVFNHNLVE